ncbi:hypothetical protein NHQ30_007569 [Ciborinia camelliae]|nr:hypothetical protein NHQ30_007569 [Ciborinia camelliae]
MVHYEQRKPRLVLRNAPARGSDSPRLVLRQQRPESPFPNGNNTTNLPLHLAYLQQPYHGSFQTMIPGNLPYATFQSQPPMTYSVPLNMNMAPGHLALQTDNTRNHHQNVTVHNVERSDEMYAGCVPVLEERRDENTGRVSPRVALRTMMQQALRPNAQYEKLGRETHYTQHSHYPRNAFGLDPRGASVESDVSICPRIDRGLEANIREQLARSGLLRDCPEPEYVNRPMAVDPSIVSCGRALKQHDPIHHRRPQYLFGQTQSSEEVRFARNRELQRAPLVNNISHAKVQRNTGIPTYKAAAPQPRFQQIQTYRGVDSVVREPKRRDSPQLYKVEAGPKFLTKDDYTPTKTIVGYYVESTNGSPNSVKKISVQPLKNQEDTTPKSFRQPVKGRLGGASEPELTEAPVREGKYKVNMSEDTPKASIPAIKAADCESPIKPIKTTDTHAATPKKYARVTVQEVSDEETDTSPDGKKTVDLLQDCIRSLATWDKGDRKILHKILKVLKRLDDDDDAKPIEDLEIAYDANCRSRKERSSGSSLNPNAACFEDFPPARANITHTGEGYHEQRRLSLQEEIIPTSDEMLPMFYPKPLMSTEPVWIKTQPRKLVRPPPGLSIPFKSHVGRKVPVKTVPPRIPSENEKGRIAKAMDHRLAEPLLARFYEKYPLTGTICINPPSPPPAPVKNAAEIQEELERLLLQEKEKKALANPLAAKPRGPKVSCRAQDLALVN